MGSWDREKFDLHTCVLMDSSDPSCTASHISMLTQGVSSVLTYPCGLQQVLRLFGTDESYSSIATTICILTDDVLLEIFDHYRNICHDPSLAVWKWHLLVHVCRRWRQIIFDSPRHLDIGILCTDKTPVSKNFNIWPHLPIIASLGNSPGQRMETISSLHLKTPVVYVISGTVGVYQTCGWKRCPL